MKVKIASYKSELVVLVVRHTRHVGVKENPIIVIELHIKRLRVPGHSIKKFNYTTLRVINGLSN